MNELEIGKPIKGYEGRYKISNLGNVGSHYINDVMTKSYDRYGYEKINLTNSEGQRTFTVHRLVMINFKKNGFRREQIHHINGDTKDNRLSNLKGVTREVNMKDKRSSGAPKPRLKVVHDGVIYDNVSQCAKAIGVSYKRVYNSLKGVSKQDLGVRYHKDVLKDFYAEQHNTPSEYTEEELDVLGECYNDMP